MLKQFLKEFHRFTKDGFEVAVKWKIRQVKILFPLENKSIHPSCVIEVLVHVVKPI